MDFEYSLSFPKLVLFGDSITERCFQQFPYADFEADGYGTAPDWRAQFCLGAALSDAYKRRMTVVSRGFSGYNPEHCRIIIPRMLDIEQDVEICTVFLGTNDAASALPDRVEFSRSIDNMEYIIGEIRRRGVRPIVIGPALHHKKVFETLDAKEVAKGIFRSTEGNRHYSEGLKELCTRLAVPFIDLYAAFMKLIVEGTETIQTLLLDGIHFNGTSYKVLYNEIICSIEQHYPEWHPSRMKVKLPTWSEVSLSKLEDINR